MSDEISPELKIKFRIEDKYGPSEELIQVACLYKVQDGMNSLPPK